MIQEFQDILSRRLLLWAALSMAAGGLLLATGPTPWLRGFAVQALAWGAIDAAIAVAGRRSARKGRPAVERTESRAREAGNLRRLLWINSGLDVLYMAGGALLLFTLGMGDPFAAGGGWGVILQGGFLLVFDVLHALAAPRQEPPRPTFIAFDGPEHAAFRLDGGRPAALLVHGFGGTPAEMRGLADALYRNRWTVQAPLLPGFGADIATLTERRVEEWTDAVEAAGTGLLEAGHRPLLLVGHSLGAALALAAAGAVRPDGLVLVAPFWWEERWWMRPVEFLVRPLLPTGFRPLRKADLADPRLRQGITSVVKGIDLDDPAAQVALRELRLPLGLIDQLRGASRRMLAAIPLVTAPVLAVQGSQDPVVRPRQTRRLLRLFAYPPAYVEVDAGHDLILPRSPGYAALESAVLQFAAGLRGPDA